VGRRRLYTLRPTFPFPGTFKARETILFEKVMFWSSSRPTCRMLLFCLDHMKAGIAAVTKLYRPPQKLNKMGKGCFRRYAVLFFMARKDAKLV